MRLGAAAVLFGLASLGLAQADLVGINQYPQFRGLSGLPGGGFGVTIDGRPSIDGALSLSSPVAYSLAGGRYAVAFSSISEDLAVRFSGGSGSDLNTRANATAMALAGFDLGIGRLSAGFSIYSATYDTGINLHFTPRQAAARPQFAFGVIDVAGESGTSGDSFGDIDARNSTSTYACVTGVVARRTYLTLGVGSARYKFGFGSISTPVFDRARLMVEHDGFNVNTMLGYAPAALRFGRGEGTITAGLVRLKYATVGLALTF